MRRVAAWRSVRGAFRHNEKRQSSNAWVCVWASDFSCDSAVKTYQHWRWQAERAVRHSNPEQKAGLCAPRASRGHRKSPERCEQLSRALFRTFLRFTDFLGEVRRFLAPVMGTDWAAWLLGSLPVASVCLRVAARLSFELSASTDAVRGAESAKSRKEERRFPSLWRETCGGRRCPWRASYSPGD